MRAPQLDRMLRALDADQRTVVDWTPADGNMRVLATAGSGKTHSMTALVARLIADKVVPPNEVCVLTFGNKAAKEIGARLLGVLTPDQRTGLHVGTYHATALLALRGHGCPTRGDWRADRCLDLGGASRAPGVPSTHVLWRCAVEYGHMPGTGVASLQIGDQLGKIYAHATGLVRAHGYACAADIPDAHMPKEQDFADAWDMVNASKDALQTWDFDDALWHFREGMKVGEISKRYAVVIVDEAQDNSKIQLELAQMLCRDDGRLILTGDVRQAIHVWRGAYPELLAHADADIKAITREIRNNYRSGTEIVDLGNRIAHGQWWNIGDNARAGRKNKGFIETLEYEARSEVTDWISNEIGTGTRAGNFAILARTNAQVAEWQAELTMAGIPCAIQGGTSIFDHREVETVLCYGILSQIDAYNALDRVVNYPKRYLGRNFREALALQRGQTTLFGAIRAALPNLPRGQQRGAHELLNDLMTLRRTSWKDTPAAILRLLERDATTARRDTSPDEDAPGLYRAAAAIMGRFDDPVALYNFAQKCKMNAVTLTEGDDKPEMRVTLSTAHRAKGLEWPVVIIDANAGTFPYQRRTRAGLADPQSLDEELRLFYVASTRAREHLLYVYSAQGPSLFTEHYIVDGKEGPMAKTAPRSTSAKTARS
jgi:superfamily I DNA/RNA helicase